VPAGSSSLVALGLPSRTKVRSRRSVLEGPLISRWLRGDTAIVWEKRDVEKT
jgi:hypothetical protein